jgi:hypothetical protein
MERPTVRELTSIRRRLIIKFPVIGKLANNWSGALGRGNPTKFRCPSIFLIAHHVLTVTIKYATANHIALTKGI